MLEGGIIAKLLDEKWSTYAQGFFMKRLMILILHLITLSCAVYLRYCIPPAGSLMKSNHRR
jgi:transient receptor potential cation channel subfamily V protein 6